MYIGSSQEDLFEMDGPENNTPCGHHLDPICLVCETTSQKHLKQQKLGTQMQTKISFQECTCEHSSLQDSSDTILRCREMKKSELIYLMVKMNMHLTEWENSIRRDYDETTFALLMSYYTNKMNQDEGFISTFDCNWISHDLKSNPNGKELELVGLDGYHRSKMCDTIHKLFPEIVHEANAVLYAKLGLSMHSRRTKKKRKQNNDDASFMVPLDIIEFAKNLE